MIGDARPKFRGVPDGIALLFLLPAAILIISNAHSQHRWAAIVYGVGLVMLFGVSASYHLPQWKSERVLYYISRADYAMIYLFIAASYTPFAAAVLREDQASIVLAIAWGGATLGVLKTIFWPGAPRAITVGLYIALGWAILPFVPTLLERLDVVTFAFFFVGGIFYTFGGIVYGLRRPNTWPEHFGYHEFMHLFIIAGAATQYFAEWKILVT